jgi:hypothetical protein
VNIESDRKGDKSVWILPRSRSTSPSVPRVLHDETRAIRDKYNTYGSFLDIFYNCPITVDYVGLFHNCLAVVHVHTKCACRIVSKWPPPTGSTVVGPEMLDPRNVVIDMNRFVDNAYIIS